MDADKKQDPPVQATCITAAYIIKEVRGPSIRKNKPLCSWTCHYSSKEGRANVHALDLIPFTYTIKYANIQTYVQWSSFQTDSLYIEMFSCNICSPCYNSMLTSLLLLPILNQNHSFYKCMESKYNYLNAIEHKNIRTVVIEHKNSSIPIKWCSFQYLSYTSRMCWTIQDKSQYLQFCTSITIRNLPKVYPNTRHVVPCHLGELSTVTYAMW